MRLSANRSWFFLTPSVAAFVTSLFGEDFLANGTWGCGWSSLAIGWLGLFALPQTPANGAWLANPLILLAWAAIALRRGFAGGIFATLALGIGLLPIVFRSIVVDESGIPRAIDGYATGYWLWVGSMVLALVAAFTIPTQSTD